MNEKTEIPMVCNHCAYSWNYKGKNPYYATCPHCLGKVKVPNKPIAIEHKTPKASGGFRDMVKRVK